MKISPINDAVRLLSQVREKQDADGNSRQQQKHQQSPDQPKKDEPEFQQLVDDAKVNAAIDSFQHDPQAQSQNLSVSAAGNGPGLRVVLKDGNGAVVRQFTGEEFVRLREAASKDGRRGKILDLKS